MALRADSFSLRDFLRLSNREKVPDNSRLSRTPSRLPHEAHEKVFGWLLRNPTKPAKHSNMKPASIERSRYRGGSGDGRVRAGWNEGPPA